MTALQRMPGSSGPRFLRGGPLRNPVANFANLASLAILAVLACLAGCGTLPMWMVAQWGSRVSDHRHFDNAPLAPATAPLPLPERAATLQWPGGADTAAAETMLAGHQTLALLVIRRGELIYERYFNGHTRTSVSGSMSVAKSVVSALVGIAVAEGRIASLDEPVTRWLPELLGNDPRFGQITLRHLLLMRSGIAFDEGYGSPFSEAARFYLTDNLQSEVRRLRIKAPPDQAYDYKSGDTQLLAMALQRAVGQPLPRYAESRLWQPMGAEHSASWSLDSAAQGQVRAFCCINATALDFARFGLLYLNGGQAAGRTVVPADWVRDSTAAQNRPGADEAARGNIERPGQLGMAYYGWQWRRAPVPAVPGVAPGSPLRPPGDDFYAQGLHGQFVYIAPATQTVIVRLGAAYGPLHWPTWMGRVAQLNP